MRITPRRILRSGSDVTSGSNVPSHLAGALFALFFAAASGCQTENSDPAGGAVGSDRTGGSRGGSGGSRMGGSGGGSTPATGGSGSGGGGGVQAPGGSGGGSGGAMPPADGSGGAGGAGGSGDAAAEVSTGGAAGDAAVDLSGGAGADAPSATRPDGMGAPCATGGNYNFTLRSFPAQKGTFTAFFTVTPSRAPTNSVIGLSDGQKYIHDHYSAIVRFAENGNLDARNGTGYSSITPIPYKVTEYHFRLVVNVPERKYAAYVSFEGKPEITIGTDLAFRDTAATPAQLNYWGVEAIAPHQTKVCGFLVQ